MPFVEGSAGPGPCQQVHSWAWAPGVGLLNLDPPWSCGRTGRAGVEVRVYYGDFLTDDRVWGSLQGGLGSKALILHQGL